MKINNFSMTDTNEVRELITKNPPYVVSYNQYTYWILQNYFSSTCKVLRIGNDVAGYISAMPSADKNTLFIWQLCIDTRFRRRGLGKLLIRTVTDEAIRLGYKNLQLSISDINIASQTLFKRFAIENKLNIFEIEKVKFEEFTEIIFQIDI